MPPSMPAKSIILKTRMSRLNTRTPSRHGASGKASGTRRCRRSAGMDQAAAHPARRRGAGGAGVAARDKVRRLPHSCSAGPWRGAAADAHRARLDAQIPADRGGRGVARRQAGLSRRRCGVGPDGITTFSMIQNASDTGDAAGLVFFLFDLLYLDGDDFCARPLQERKTRLAALLSKMSSPLQYSDHQIGHGRAFFEQACHLSVEGIVSKRADAPYTPGNRGHCTSFSIPIAICRRRIPVAPASRPTRSRLRPPSTCRPSDPVHRGAARSFPRNSSMDVRCCGVRNDIVGAAQDCSRGPD
jgi:hypothetical protein